MRKMLKSSSSGLRLLERLRCSFGKTASLQGSVEMLIKGFEKQGLDLSRCEQASINV